MFTLFNVLNVIWGWLLPLIVEKLFPKVKGSWKVALAVTASVISGFVAVGLAGELEAPYNVEMILGAVGAIFIASQLAWRNTWHKFFEK